MCLCVHKQGVGHIIALFFIMGNVFNPNECNVLHHRVKSISVSNNIFTLGHENVIKTVESCTYLGCLIIDAQVDFKNCINTLAQPGTRALGTLIHKK